MIKFLAPVEVWAKFGPNFIVFTRELSYNAVLRNVDSANCIVTYNRLELSWILTRVHDSSKFEQIIFVHFTLKK